MTETTKHIEAFDCLPFKNSDATADVLQEFIETQSNNVFYFSPDFQTDDESPLAEYDYKQKLWTAGRFVGEAIFPYKNENYKITIKPRFGENILFRMLEEIFNIRITQSKSESIKQEDWQHYIKKIIAFIWLQKLANANLHGLPRTQIKKVNKGHFKRGHLDIRKSIQPYYQSGEVISVSREREIDSTIAKIIGEAYSIIKKDFLNGSLNIPDSAQEAINQINSVVRDSNSVQENDYKAIRYKEIYLSWKPLVDFSWDIIKRKQLSLKQNEKSKKGLGFFIDMAEVWEQYLRAILKKNLLPYGWHLRKERSFAYKGFFYQRELIPDLVFQNENEIAIWDAKYKRMLGRPFDVDRSDFFQIHTYLQHHLKNKKVKAGGLIYPVSTPLDFEKCRSNFLLNDEGFNTNFSIDGIEMTELSETSTDLQVHQEKQFINRILNSIN